MSQSEFEQRIQRLERELQRQRQLRNGTLRYRTITIETYTVPSYEVGRHKRRIAAKRPLSMVKGGRSAA